MTRYAIVTENDIPAEGDRAPGAAGTVVNIIVWDGEAAYAAETGYRLVQSDTLDIGDITLNL